MSPTLGTSLGSLAAEGIVAVQCPTSLVEARRSRPNLRCGSSAPRDQASALRRSERLAVEIEFSGRIGRIYQRKARYQLRRIVPELASDQILLSSTAPRVTIRSCYGTASLSI